MNGSLSLSILGFKGGALVNTATKAGQALGEYVVDRFQNHTIAGRMVNGESLGEAVKNHFNEDTIIGQLLQGKSFNEACENTTPLGTGATGSAAVEVAKTLCEKAESIFSDNK